MKKFSIVISRQFGSLGRPIAKEMSEILGVEYYDRDIVTMVAKEHNITIREVSNLEEKSSRYAFMKFPLGNGTVAAQDKIFNSTARIIRELAEKESCIIVGRCADAILGDNPDNVNIFIYAPYEERLVNCVNELGMELARHRHILAGLQPGIRCPMCYQTVTQETLPALKDEFEATIRRICAQGKELSGQLDELHGLDEKAREVFEAFRAQDIAMCNLELADIELRRQQAVDAVRAENERRQQKISEIREEIQNIELDLETGRLSSEEMVELECFKERAKALEAEIEVLTEQQGSSMGADVAPGISAEEINAEIVKKNELLTALSSYIAERVRQRFDHLDLNRVSISLYEVSKTTGEVRDVFKFNYEDRPYVILSLSEKIKAGLEVSELLKKIAGINYPVFIDNGESVPVIDNVRPSGQTFISQVVKNEQLRVEILGAAPAGRSEQAA